AETQELRYYYQRYGAGTGGPLTEEAAKTKAEAVLREIYGTDFENGYHFDSHSTGYGQLENVVTFRRSLHGVDTVDAMTVIFCGGQVLAVDAREKDYFGENATKITKEMVDRAMESMRIYLGLETMNPDLCMLKINADGRVLLECLYDQEYFIEVK
ncbi:MAG: hypothetical protein II337_08450, partial [Clostridia bacterium]|nr:hypothetical protein [Clostridia bacterium]